MLSHIHRVASHQIIIISSLPPFHCRWIHVFVSDVKLTIIFYGVRETVHGYTQAVISALHVTLGGAVGCQTLKHVTLKNVVRDDIVIDCKLEDLRIYCFLRHSGEGNLIKYRSISNLSETATAMNFIKN